MPLDSVVQDDCLLFERIDVGLRLPHLLTETVHGSLRCLLVVGLLLQLVGELVEGLIDYKKYPR